MGPRDSGTHLRQQAEVAGRKNIKSVDALDALFTGVCAPRKRQRDGQLFPPALAFRMSTKNGKIDVKCIDKNGKDYDITAVQSGNTPMRVIFRHRVDFKNSSIEVKNEPVLVQVMECIRPTSFAHVI